jgi:hypothetical protein
MPPTYPLLKMNDDFKFGHSPDLNFSPDLNHTQQISSFNHLPNGPHQIFPLPMRIFLLLLCQVFVSAQEPA